MSEGKTDNRISRRNFLRGILSGAALYGLDGVLTQKPRGVGASTPVTPSSTPKPMETFVGNKVPSVEVSETPTDSIDREKINMEKEYALLIERYNHLKAESFYNPPLYEGYEPADVMKDIKNNDIDHTVVVQAEMYVLFRMHTFPEYPPSKGELTFLKSVVALADTYLKVEKDSRGNDPVNSEIKERLFNNVNWICGVWGNGDEPWSHGGVIYELDHGLNSIIDIGSLYDKEKVNNDTSEKLRGTVTELLDKGILKDDNFIHFLLFVADFDDLRCAKAANLTFIKMLDLLRASEGNNLSASELLKKSNRYEEAELFPILMAYGSSYKVWGNIDWNEYSERMETDGAAKACKYIASRKIAWQEYIGVAMNMEIEPSRVIRGVPIYGEDTPLNEEEIKAIFLATTGELFKGGRIPSDEEISLFRSQQNKPEERGLELFLPASSWIRLKAQLAEEKMEPGEWLLLYADVLEKMIKSASPEIDLNVVLKRIVIIDDNTFLERADRYRKLTGKPKENDYFFHHPQDSAAMIDTLSPLSFDVHGRWMMNYNVEESGYTSRLVLANGKKVKFDGGLVHELAHQEFYMSDQYRGNTIDVKDKLEGNLTSNVPRGFKSVDIMGFPGTEYITMGGTVDPTYPWTEAIYLLWTKTKDPRHFKSNYFVPYDKRGVYPLLSDKTLDIAISTQKESALRAKMFPLVREDGDFLVPEVTGDVLHFSARDLNTRLYNSGKRAWDYLLEVTTNTDHKYLLPIPVFVFDAAFCMADLEEKEKPVINLTFHQPSYNGANYKGLERLNFYMIPPEKRTEMISWCGDNLYAEMNIQFQGKIYSLMWATQMTQG